ncbi:hypothetical protein [Bradyrhizobium lablabi]|nr:hypothetical protein [Bradyrhizobium lablabi]
MQTGATPLEQSLGVRQVGSSTLQLSAGIASGPQDSISDPVSSIPPAPVHSAPRPKKEAAPLFSSAGSVEQATRDNLAGPTPLLRSSAILGSGATSVDPELEAAICALEAQWSLLDISASDRIMNNSTSLRSRAFDSMSANLVQASASSSTV